MALRILCRSIALSASMALVFGCALDKVPAPDGTSDADAATPGDDASSADTTSDDDASSGDTASDEGPVSDADAEGIGTDGETSEVDAGPQPIDVQAACAASCAAIEASCGDAATPGGGVDACIGECATKAGESASWLPSYACMAETCDAPFCLDPGPLSASCFDACTALDACDLLGVFGEEDVTSAATCAAGCSHMLTEEPGSDLGIACLIGALSGGCDEAAVEACLGEPTMTAECQELCGFFYDAASEAYCEPGRPIRAAWPDAATCAAACSSLAGPVAVGAFFGCVVVSDCGDATACASVPAALAQPCMDGCQAMADLCGASFAVLEDVASCAMFCTGALHPQGGPAPEGPACVGALTVCPAAESDQLEALLQCLAPQTTPGSACQALCPIIDGCYQSVEGQLPAGWDCLATCTADLLPDEQKFYAVASCVMDNEADCPEVLQCLTSPSGGFAVCSSWCGKMDFVCGAGSPDCVDTCQAALAADATHLATVACQFIQQCGNALCDEIEVPAACLEACAASPDTCGAYADGCVQACAGLLAGWSGTPPVAAATCMVEALGPPCDLAKTIDCNTL